MSQFNGDTTIAGTGLSVRAQRVLMNMGLRTLGDVVKKSRGDLTSARHCGLATLQEIEGWLRSCGVNFLDVWDTPYECLLGPPKPEKFDEAETCENCQFIRDIDKDDPDYQQGFCHRRPPQVFDSSPNSIQEWCFPLMRTDDWCGEWKAKR